MPDPATRAAIAGAAWIAAGHDADLDLTDAERLIRLTERLGDVAHAYRAGHFDLESELLELAGRTLGWLEAINEQRRCAPYSSASENAA